MRTHQKADSSATFLRLSTSEFAEHDRIEAARELFGRTIINVEFEPERGADFNMEMVLRELPNCGVASGTRSAMDCVHTAGSAGRDDIVLTVALSGRGTFYFHGKETQITEGMATMVRTASDGRLRIHTDSNFISFRFPFKAISPLIANIDASLANLIPANTQSLRLLTSYAGLLNDENAMATLAMRSAISSHLLDLAALSIGATRDAAYHASGGGIRAARLQMIKEDIARSLNLQKLSMKWLAARHAITPRYISKLFEGEEQTFAEYVAARRLDRVHRQLINRQYAKHSVSSLAFDAGFGDLSSFNRAFRRRYGATPSEIRASVGQ
jgi:AraC-like DNA-binding protein